MNDFDELLNAALADRGRRLMPSPGSMTDVRRRARGRARRRSIVAAGAVTAVGATGVAAVLAGGGDNNERVLTADEGHGEGPVSAAGEVWRCRGPLGVESNSAGVTTIPANIVSTTVEAPGPSTTVDLAGTTTTVAMPDSTSVATSTTVTGDQTTSTLPAIADVTSTSMLSQGVVEREYYFQHCELVDTSADDTTNSGP